MSTYRAVNRLILASGPVEPGELVDLDDRQAALAGTSIEPPEAQAQREALSARNARVERAVHALRTADFATARDIAAELAGGSVEPEQTAAVDVEDGAS
jgi:hypothetical protein